MHLTYGDDVVYLIETMIDDKEEAIEVAPEWDKANKDDYGKQQEFSKKLDMFIKRKAVYKRNKKKLYTIFYGQCTPCLLSGIKSASDFTKKDKKKDPIWIMKDPKTFRGHRRDQEGNLNSLPVHEEIF